jgi:hypothetical protein
MQHRPAGGATYRDSLIAIRDGTLVIGRYYFSTGAKHIRLAAITGVQEYAMTKATGRWRTWGSGDLIHWFNLDPGRRHKQRAFIIDLGRRAKPVITPDAPDAFRAALVAAGIRVLNRAPDDAHRP